MVFKDIVSVVRECFCLLFVLDRDNFALTYNPNLCNDVLKSEAETFQIASIFFTYCRNSAGTKKNYRILNTDLVWKLWFSARFLLSVEYVEVLGKVVKWGD